MLTVSIVEIMRVQRANYNTTLRWAMMLPASIQVCPVEIPGRGRREGEHGINSIGDLANTLALVLPLQVRDSPDSENFASFDGILAFNNG